MTQRQRDKVPVYAILRVDLGIADPEMAVAVKEIVPSLEEAEAEVQRLNRINADKKCHYIWRATRFFQTG